MFTIGRNLLPSDGMSTDAFQKKKLLLAAQLREQKREYRDLFEKLARAKVALRGFRQNKQQVDARTDIPASHPVCFLLCGELVQNPRNASRCPHNYVCGRSILMLVADVRPP